MTKPTTLLTALLLLTGCATTIQPYHQAEYQDAVRECRKLGYAEAVKIAETRHTEIRGIMTTTAWKCQSKR